MGDNNQASPGLPGYTPTCPSCTSLQPYSERYAGWVWCRTCGGINPGSTGNLNPEYLNVLHGRGASARTRGLALADCPFRARSETPAVTGEPMESWQQKVNAWEAGWHADDAWRAGRTAS